MGAGVVQLLDARLLQEQVHHIRRQLCAVSFAIETAQQIFSRLGLLRLAKQFELIAAIADFDTQTRFDQAQVLVELPAEIGEALGFERFEGEAMRFYGSIQSRILAASRLG